MTDAAASAKKEVNPVQVTVDQNLSTVTLKGAKVEISPEGNVVVFTSESVQTKPAATTSATAATEDKQFSIGKDFNTVAMYGATIELATDGSLIVYTNGTVKVKPAPANDTSVAALMVGQKMADGSVFAGMTADGTSQIYAMPEDLDVTMTFNDAAKAVKKLNRQKYLGHNDWQIGSIGVIRVLQKVQNEGALTGTFNTTNNASGSCYPGCYWSSTEDRDDPRFVYYARFSDGEEYWHQNDNYRLSCRPVRLVAVSSPSLG